MKFRLLPYQTASSDFLAVWAAEAGTTVRHAAVFFDYGQTVIGGELSDFGNVSGIGSVLLREFLSGQVTIRTMAPGQLGYSLAQRLVGPDTAGAG